MGKICVVSDIHSNIHSLKKFLKYLDENYNIDYILNLGDFLQDGPNPCEVFDLVMNDKRFINIMGNKEYELININFNKDLYIDEEESHVLWTLEKLGSDRIEKIKKLPLYKSIEIFDKKFFMIHANYEYADSFSGDGLVTVITEKALKEFSTKEQILNINSHDYLLIADNHLECLESHGGYKIIKPGAISSLNNNTIKFVVIDTCKNNETIEFKSLKHDAYEVVKECIRNDVPDPYWDIYTNKIKKETYDVCISPKYDPSIIPIDWSFFPFIIKKWIKNSEFIELSCLNNEITQIDEIRLKLNVVEENKIKNDLKQIRFKLKVDNKLINFLTNDFLNKNKLKWLNLYFYLKSTKDIYFICEHNGYEIRLINLNQDDVNYLKSIIDNKTVSIDFY